MLMLTDNLFFNNTPICQFSGHQSIVFGNKLYVDGGMLQGKGDNGIDWKDYRDLRIYDFSNLTSRIDGGQNITSPALTVIERPPQYLNTRLGTLWADTTRQYIYRYGGNAIDPISVRSALSQYSVQSALLQFDTQASNLHSPDAWSLPHNATPPAITRLAYGAGARHAETGEGYYLGGFDDLIGINHSSSQTEIAGMKPNLVLWKGGDGGGVSNSWVNQTVTVNDKSDQITNPAGASGVLVHMPVGNKGMLMSLGGRPYEAGTATNFPLDVVRIYDIAAGKWYSQQTTGEIPQPRNNFCGVVATAKDNSSYNVYIHGGQTGGSPAGTDDVYVLTVPTFQWVKAYQGNMTARAYHTCEIINKQQMLVIGGFNATDIGPQTCARDMGGDLRTFDMSNFSFSDFDIKKVNYAVPGGILSVIGGTVDGGATKTEPSQGWTDPLFQTAFSNAKNNILPSASTSNPPGSPPPPSQSSRPSHSSALVPGAIAGVVVGSIVAASLLVLLLIFWRKKHSSPKQQITLLLENGEKPLPHAPHGPGDYAYPNNSSHKLGPTVSNQSRGLQTVVSPISPVSDSDSDGDRHSPSLPQYARSPTIPYGDRRPTNNHIASQQRGALSPQRPEAARTRSIHELPAHSVADDLDRIGVLPKFSEHSMRSMREAQLREGRTSPIVTEKSTPI
ncbi:MAG: hypothetical protein M1835_003167 [Candelina submexicana]|nr:MAG: hypothetical protein M1835_003167 [Candelina submexicana]